MTVEDSKKRWKQLRDCYARSVKKLNTSGQAADDPKEGWAFSGHMSFLKDLLKPRKSRGNYSEEPEEDSDSLGAVGFPPPLVEFTATQTEASTSEASISSTPRRPTVGERRAEVQSKFLETLVTGGLTDHPHLTKKLHGQPHTAQNCLSTKDT